ncbi:MAG: transketolase family protein, partial [Bacteroidales bacterium]|nr:transketolase family protein [Bacteroidales bacterium]
MESVNKTGCAVTAEEHFIAGGMGEMIAGVLAAEKPVPVEYVAINDRFGQSGTPAELMKAYGLDAEHIVAAAKKAIKRK